MHRLYAAWADFGSALAAARNSFSASFVFPISPSSIPRFKCAGAFAGASFTARRSDFSAFSLSRARSRPSTR